MKRRALGHLETWGRVTHDDWPVRAHWVPCPDLARQLEASSRWTSHRESDLSLEIECEVARTACGYVILTRIPLGYEAHALRLELGPLLPEKTTDAEVDYAHRTLPILHGISQR